MKLAIITAFPPSKTTLNEYGYHLVKNFCQQSNVDEIVIMTDISQDEAVLDFEHNGCKISVQNCWKFNSYKNIISITKALKEAQPDAVLYNLQFLKFGDKKIPAALGLMLPMISKGMRIPTISLLHNILEQVDLNKAGFTKNKLFQKVFNTIGTFLTKCILRSDTVALTMEKYVNILEEKYNATNVIHIPHGTFEIAKKPEYTLKDGPLKVMTFGKFGTYKKVEIMIDAVIELRKKVDYPIEIVVAGTDNPNTKGYLQSVADHYKNVPLLNFTGYVAEEDVPTVFQESAVIVFPYTSTTGSSGVLHQAGSYGKAVVMPDIGDLNLLVTGEGYQGEFFEPNNTISLENAIKNILDNNRYRIKLGKANYKAATAFPMSKITDKYLHEFYTIMNANVYATQKRVVQKV